jgi:NAD(P)-dependent dehydrogenase (short-subunit alcohol dehydrogenase family)
MKTALITGAGRRLGREIALALAADGYALYLHCWQSTGEAVELARQLIAQGVQATPLQADLVRADDAAGLLARCHEFGPVTLLVNNAATYAGDEIADFTATGFDAQFAVNLRAPLLLSQAFAAQLPDDEKGLIVNLLDYSVGAISARYLTYSLSKAALATATEALALALAPRIRACGIAPGMTLPSQGMSEAKYRELQTATLLKNGPTPADIIAALRYLIDAESTTGQIIYVDGGQHLITRRQP